MDLISAGALRFPAGRRFLPLEPSSLIGVIHRALEAPMKRLIVGCCIAMIAGPSFAQPKKTQRTFYVVLNSLTKRCVVVDKPPRTDTPNITVASDAVFQTRAEAETAVKTLKPCMP
jgi:hypothetical protein